jgi:hypothetical protein
MSASLSSRLTGTPSRKRNAASSSFVSGIPLPTARHVIQAQIRAYRREAEVYLDEAIELELGACYESKTESEFYYHLGTYARLLADRRAIAPLPFAHLTSMPRASAGLAHVGAAFECGREVL